ncbi:hypothetical protein [Vagococcus silagei]|uniref:Uncharacterized protein n=1 Tax=Vagococcus silagei TaxID=2508885 RepID=A0A4V3TV76_9ENTE|nr:hypothetical protein [Vagococcus silagei]THB61809.1 hypothetical protein ESZ54_03285 [Vagococcus silagei]
MAKEKLLKSEKIRIKNDELRKKGKEPAQGWGEMVNTKFGGGGAGSGLNGSATKFDHMGAVVEEQKNKRNETL